jgi:hypothetical protein
MPKGSRDSIQSFSSSEMAFFRSGEQTDATGPIETFADLDGAHTRRPSLWQRLFGKKTSSP